MRIITKSPIVKNGRIVANGDLFSNAFGAITPSWQQSKPTPSAQTTFNTPAPIVTTGSQSPKVVPKETKTTKSLGKKLFDKLLDTEKIVTPPVAEESKKQMSTTTKVLIGVGGAAILGTLIYFIVKK